MNGTPFSAAWSMVWMAGQVASRTVMRPAAERGGEARRGARLAERDGAGFHRGNATRADQQVGRVTGDWNAEQAEAAFSGPDQRAGEGTGHERIVRRQREQRSVRYKCGQLVQGQPRDQSPLLICREAFSLRSTGGTRGEPRDLRPV